MTVKPMSREDTEDVSVHSPRSPLIRNPSHCFHEIAKFEVDLSVC
jgi:hypothetical protein